MLRFCLPLFGGCLLLACSPQQSTDTTTGPAPVPADSLRPAPDSPVAPAPNGSATDSTPAAAASGWPAPFRPAADRQCVRTATGAATIYQRPDAATPKFGQLTAGENVTLAARTADGWVGFDPATAQAANVGVFRLRWVRAADAFGAEDAACARLPLVAAPPYACLLMAGRAVPVRARPAADAPLLSTIPAGSYARIREPAAAPAPGWQEIAVPGRAVPGYVAAADVNQTGPCR